MPSPKFMNAKASLAAVKDGSVKESTIDEQVLRLFRTELRYGFPTAPIRSRRLHLLRRRSPVALEEARSKASRCSRTKAGFFRSTRQNQDHRHHRPPAVNAWPVSILTGIASLLGPDAHVFYRGRGP
jgi:hypothetical protein